MTDAETVAAPSASTRDRLADPGLLRGPLDCARAAHAHQQRKDGSPFIGHPIAVAEIVATSGFDEEVVAAGVLHDVVEASEIELEEIERRFGERVRDLVGAMTEDSEIEDYRTRKDAQREQVEAAGRDAVAIYAADKLANLRDVRRAYSSEGEAIGDRFEVSLDARISIWREDLEAASRCSPELGFLRELRYELESLEEQRARRDGAESPA